MSSVATFRVRLAEANRASELPAASRFNLAASDIDHDTLEKAVEPFGAPYGEVGFGTSDVFNELLSRDPKYLKVSDLTAHQESLVTMGYADGLSPDGVWSPAWADAQRRSSRDAFNTVKSGGSYLAAPVKTVFRYLGYTIPSEAFKGMHGIAQGIVSDAARAATNPVEVFEEGGLAGGAVTGAGIGAAIGTVIPGAGTAAGAVIGGAIGGAAGFFADLFDDDEEEEGAWENIIGALSPIDEIKSGDAKNLFAALSTIMTASAVLKAGSVAAQGVRAATAAPVATGGVSAAGMAFPTFQAAGQAGLRESFRLAAKGTVAPGIAGQIGRAALKRPVVGSAALGGIIDATPELLTGDFGEAAKDFVKGAAIGAVAGPLIRKTKLGQKAVDKALAGIEAAPLARLAKSPAGRVTQALYTGAVTPTIVARGVGDLSGKSGTAIKEDIDNAPDLGIAGDVIDLTIGMVVFPERLMPWRGKDVGTAFTNINKSKALKAAGANHELMPWALDRAATDNIPLAKAFDLVRDDLGRNYKTGGYEPHLVGVRATERLYQKGLDDAAEDILRARRTTQDLTDDWARDAAFREIRAELHSKVLKEATDPTNIATSPTAKSYIDNAKSNPVSMQTSIARDRLAGSTPDMASVHQEALEFLADKPRARTKIVDEEVSRLMDDGMTYDEAFDAMDMVSLEERVKKATTISPAIKGVYVTQQDVTRARTAYEAAATGYKQAHDAVEAAIREAKKAKKVFKVEDSPQFKAKVSAGEALDNVLLEMKRRDLIDGDKYESLRPSGKLEYNPSKTLTDDLDEIAKSRPREVEAMTKELDAKFGQDNHYIAVATGENLVDYASFAHQAEVSGLAEYTRRAAFFDHLSAIGTKVERADIAAMRFTSAVAHLDKTTDELFVAGRMDGKQLADAIYDETKHRYDPEWMLRNRKTEVKLPGRGNIVTMRDETGKIKRELFKIDPRDLTPDDIVKAAHLDSPGMLKPGVDPYEAAHKIKRALHVGTAFGADVAHPIATARSLGASLRVNGLPGFNDFMRTTTFVPTKFALKGQRFKKGSYGYLPQTLRRAHMAVQFSLSPTFDASRFAEAMAFGKMRGGDIPLKMATNAKRFVTNFEEGFIHPTTGKRVQGTEAFDAMVEFGDELLYGRAVNKNFDEVQLQLLNQGALGYKPREVEYGMAFWLASRKAAKGPLSANDLDEIKETVMQITQYGAKQTSIGNTAHFVFFPFLFSRKQLSAMVDFTLAAPTRNLLVHEGFRRWYQVTDDESLSSKFGEFMEKHVPLAKELERINNLAYGVSPGRFFLDGIMDKPTEGKVAQALGAFFLPGGVHSTVGDTLGAATSMTLRSDSDLNPLKQFFVPQVWVDDGKIMNAESGDYLNLAERLIPAYRDIDRWFFDQEGSGSEFGLLGAQKAAITSGASPYSQMSDYLDTKKVLSAHLESTAAEMGYSSVETLKDNHPQYAAAINEIDLYVGSLNPEGKALSNTFTNKAEVKEQVIYEINNKDQRTAAEDTIAAIGMVEAAAKAKAAALNVSQQTVLMAYAPIIRQFAISHINDRQFNNLWDELFLTTYGPLRQMEVA